MGHVILQFSRPYACSQFQKHFLSSLPEFLGRLLTSFSLRIYLFWRDYVEKQNEFVLRRFY